MGRRVRPAPQRPRIAPHAPHARTRRAPAPASRTWGASRACRRRCRSCSKRRRAGTLPPSRRPTWRASWVEAATAASRWTWANSICRCRGCRLRWRCEQRAALGHGPTRGPIRRMRACAIQRARIALARAGAETQTQRLGHGRQKQGRATAVVRRKSVRDAGPKLLALPGRCMSAPHVVQPQEAEAERAAAAKVLLSPSLLAFHARAAGLTVPAMRLQLLKVRRGRRSLRRRAGHISLRATGSSCQP